MLSFYGEYVWAINFALFLIALIFTLKEACF